MQSLTLRAPAKLNLYLKVISRRPDGYHNIVTLFEKINLFDEITLKATPKKSIHIKCDHPDVPRGPKNLVYKVAEKLQRDFSVNQGVEITIKKRIPVAAGLGGGSSNAATVLKGLDRLWNLKISPKRMLKYAYSVGSDVAFFLYDTSWALGTQRGEKIRPLNLRTKLFHVLVVMKIPLYSWEVYGLLRNWRLTKKVDDVRILLHYLRKKDFPSASRYLKNDLERPVFDLCPRLLMLKNELRGLQTQGVMISGSGPALFGITATRKQAEDIKFKMRKRFKQVFVVTTLV